VRESWAHSRSLLLRSKYKAILSRATWVNHGNFNGLVLLLEPLLFYLKRVSLIYNECWQALDIRWRRAVLHRWDSGVVDRGRGGVCRVSCPSCLAGLRGVKIKCSDHLLASQEEQLLGWVKDILMFCATDLCCSYCRLSWDSRYQC
jgi:hypothetical protein